jgi:hypothetical protein
MYQRQRKHEPNGAVLVLAATNAASKHPRDSTALTAGLKARVYLPIPLSIGLLIASRATPQAAPTGNIREYACNQ